MKITQVITGLLPYGAEHQMTALSIALKRRGHDVTVISLMVIENNRLTEDLGSEEIPILSLGLKRGELNPFCIITLIRLLKNLQPEIVHSHLIHANILSRLCRIFIKIPVLIGTVHTSVAGPIRWKMMYRLTDPLVDLTTNVSKKATEDCILSGYTSKNKVSYIPNGVDASRFFYNEIWRENIRNEFTLTDNFVWLNVGRMEEAKDHLTLLRAFKQLHRNKPNSKLIIVGEGSTRSRIQQMAKEMELDEIVLFAGYRDDIPMVMSGCDGFVLSSAWEGFGLVIAEALLCGLPVVSTDCDGPREILLNGEAGLLVPVKKSDKLATAMENMMNMPETQRISMINKGQEHVQKQYSFNAVVNKWESTYNKFLNLKMGKTK